MEKFKPKGSMGKYFARVWLCISILFCAVLFTHKEYTDAQRIHTHNREDIDKIIAKMEGYHGDF